MNWGALMSHTWFIPCCPKFYKSYFTHIIAVQFCAELYLILFHFIYLFIYLLTYLYIWPLLHLIHFVSLQVLFYLQIYLRVSSVSIWSINNDNVVSWPVWLSWLSVIPQSERLPARFLVRTHGWVAALPGWGTCERQPVHSQPIDVSLTHWYLSFFVLPSPFSESK